MRKIAYRILLKKAVTQKIPLLTGNHIGMTPDSHENSHGKRTSCYKPLVIKSLTLALRFFPLPLAVFVCDVYENAMIRNRFNRIPLPVTDTKRERNTQLRRQKIKTARAECQKQIESGRTVTIRITITEAPY